MAPKHPWTELMATDLLDLDDEHARLLARIDAFLDAPVAGGASATTALIDAMERQILSRFDHEEICMLKADYPDMLEHVAEHGRLAGALLDLRASIEGHRIGAERARQSARAIGEWLCEHTQEYDQGFAAYLRELRARSS